MNTTTEHELVIASGSFRAAVIELLEENNLPTSDIDEGKALFALIQNEKVIGTGGLELFGDCALLRSLSVKKDWQGQGLGKFITRQLEEICRNKGIANIYLLTTTAEDFFRKEGYRVVNRADAPLSIKNSSEFSTVCPSTGILMSKII